MLGHCNTSEPHPRHVHLQLQSPLEALPAYGHLLQLLRQQRHMTNQRSFSWNQAIALLGVKKPLARRRLGILGQRNGLQRSETIQNRSGNGLETVYKRFCKRDRLSEREGLPHAPNGEAADQSQKTNNYIANADWSLGSKTRRSLWLVHERYPLCCILPFDLTCFYKY